ncbi:hypothetical protein FE257_008709 [Aspergillus nanangensis]|uniref:Mid2 domain-containing protein n=1 Tax=Aspergillus nanangensis TaxID=2582783 RepID=A0AAD4GTA5_ASPNN|nr:hypothetical protein FE257_008709 [Aspergillus nanangensis]
MTIFQTSPFGAPSATNIFCAQRWNAFQLYRELPKPTTTSDSHTSTLKSSAASSTAASQATEATQATAASQATETTQITAASQKTDATHAASTSQPSDPSSEPSPLSRAWIVGAIVGPIVGVGIFGAIIGWILYRRRKRNQRSLQQEYPFMSQDIKPQQLSNQPYELDTASTPRLYELSSQHYR